MFTPEQGCNLYSQVKGLTTAASIWLAGALGAAAGCGLWRMTLMGTLMTLLVLSTVKQLKKFMLIDSDNRRQTTKQKQESESRAIEDIQQR